MSKKFLNEEDFKASYGAGSLEDPTKATAGMKAKNKRRGDKEGQDPINLGDPEAAKATKASLGQGNGKMVEEILAELDTLTEEELQDLYDELIDDEDEDYEDVDGDEDELEDEELEEIEADDPLEGAAEAMYEAFKLTSADLDLTEFAQSVDGIQGLTEDFKTSTKNIFSSVLIKTLNERLALMCETVVDGAREVLTEREELILANLDKFLDDTIDSWTEENEVALESGIRADIAESYMAGHRALLQNHYFEVPEEKLNVVEALAEQVQELKTLVTEQKHDLDTATEIIDLYQKRDIVQEACEGMSEAEASKVFKLVENMDYENDKQFKALVDDVRGQISKSPEKPVAGGKMLNEDHLVQNNASGPKDTRIASAFALFGDKPKAKK